MFSAILWVLFATAQSDESITKTDVQEDAISVTEYRTLFTGTNATAQLLDTSESIETSQIDPVSPVVDVHSDSSFRYVMERVCHVPLICAQAAGLQSAPGFTDANLRGLGFNSDYSADQINNYAASRSTINKKTDIPRDCIGKTS